MGSPQESARSPRGGAGSGQNTSRLALIAGEVGRGLHNMGSSTKHLINPAARHEEARQRFENDVASKLMDVIEKKKLANLQVRGVVPARSVVADNLSVPCSRFFQTVSFL